MRALGLVEFPLKQSVVLHNISIESQATHLEPVSLKILQRRDGEI